MSKLQSLLHDARLGSHDRVRLPGDSSMAGHPCSFLSSASRFRVWSWFWSLWVQASAAKVLQDTCSYIRSLHREVDDLSERLSELLDAAGVSSAQAAIIRSLFMWNDLCYMHSSYAIHESSTKLHYCWGTWNRNSFQGYMMHRTVLHLSCMNDHSTHLASSKLQSSATTKLQLTI